MTASVRPTYIPRRDWRVVPVTLSADEQVALNMLAARECREREDMAARLIVLALEQQKLLPLDWRAVEEYRKWAGSPPRQGEAGDAQ